MMLTLRFTARRFTLIACALLLSGCESYRLEYDRMTGTSFPPSQTVSGATVTLLSIYLNAGYLLDAQEDQTNIAALTGPANPADPNQYDYITEAELDTIESANRTAPVGPDSWKCSWWIFSGTCSRYYLYGIVVNHFYEENDGTRRTSIMGIMWKSTNRSAFANFYRNTTVSGDGGKYLRSAAHEIGHAFNLHHEDGDGATTIMNQTSVVGDNYTYTFSANSQDHLKNHPANCVRPGSGTFGATCHTHSPYAAVASPGCI